LEGKQFKITLERRLDFDGQDAMVPVRISFSPSPYNEIVVEADDDGGFTARVDGVARIFPTIRPEHRSAQHSVRTPRIQPSIRPLGLKQIYDRVDSSE
jgi:hypothetical protein